MTERDALKVLREATKTLRQMTRDTERRTRKMLAEQFQREEIGLATPRERGADHA